MASKRLVVDVHTHLYLPRYASLLRQRTALPKIITRTGIDGQNEERLVILKDEPSGGRPIGRSYVERDEKLKFMKKHGIDISIVSTANPWLDFLHPKEAHELALQLNDDLEEYCATGPSVSGTSMRQLYGFGLLPIVPKISIESLLEAVRQIFASPHLRGIIMGTRGIGKGLDDQMLDPVWSAISEAGLTVFLHPHYGIPKEAWGEKNNGHVLPLALGFPMETTIATTRLILSGVFDRFPSLRLFLAHSGGALPQLSSRLASCIDHDPVVASRLKHDARFYLGKLYLDAVCYGPEELGFVSDVLARASRYDTGSKDVVSGGRSMGSERLLFGTDHPFFPPLSTSEKWKSVVENLDAIDNVQGWTEADKDGVKGGNAISLFNL
ncbi:amidohydrolase 2 [Lentinula aciculospora]|uniref:Amidohydrolase 2 n=1 Tax=Lentinula aciculospora TaxID=153920 RepID=A0A9W9ABU4_9AGAR|nr:amidohydrolase 2 [Lentinula aciculospora]